MNESLGIIIKDMNDIVNLLQTPEGTVFIDAKYKEEFELISKDED